jgi:hypothetical protein
LFFERIEGKWGKLKAETRGGKGFRLRQPSKVCILFILPARHSLSEGGFILSKSPVFLRLSWRANSSRRSSSEGGRLDGGGCAFSRSHPRGRKRKNSPKDLILV